MDKFRIALAQVEPHLFDKDANLAAAEVFIKQAAEGGAAAILFPELFLTGYSLGSRAVEMAESLYGLSVRRVAGLAAKYHLAVLMGFAELSSDGEHAYDAMFVVDASGDVAGSYRKMHLFHAETDWFLPGEQPVLIDFGLGPTGLLICYDLEFPEAARLLALRGARWIAVSTGNMLPNQHLQEVYLQARAAENRLWIALANRVGSEGGLTFFGGSAVADPDGEIIDYGKDKEALVYVEIDLGRSSRARTNADYLADRRPGLYRRLAES